MTENTQATDTAESSERFTILIDLPWAFAAPACCKGYQVEVWKDEHEQHFATCYHSEDCAVWRYIS